MTDKIYKAQIDTPYGLFLIAARSNEYDARADILSAARGDFNHCHPAMVKIQGEITKSNRRILAAMQPIKCTRTNSDFWAYIKRI